MGISVQTHPDVVALACHCPEGRQCGLSERCRGLPPDVAENVERGRVLAATDAVSCKSSSSICSSCCLYVSSPCDAFAPPSPPPPPRPPPSVNDSVFAIVFVGFSYLGDEGCRVRSWRLSGSVLEAVGGGMSRVAGYWLLLEKETTSGDREGEGRGEIHSVSVGEDARALSRA